MARQLRTGSVAINGGQWFGCDTPFGGYKQSGLGRENGVQGFEEFLETKSVGFPAVWAAGDSVTRSRRNEVRPCRSC